MRNLGLSVLAFSAVLATQVVAQHRHMSDRDDDVWELDNNSAVVYFEEKKDSDPEHALGVIVHSNQLSNPSLDGGPREVSVETPHGAIIFTVDVTPNGDCLPELCPDTIEVFQIPQGIVVVPPFNSTPEKTNARLLIFPDLTM